jgi:hypothetical protein
MKLYELFSEPLYEESDYVKDLEAFIIDLVVAAQSMGINKIYLPQMKKELRNNDFSLDDEFLADFLNTLDLVKSIDENTGEIVLSGEDDGNTENKPGPSKEDRAKVQVNRGAMNTLAKQKQGDEQLASKMGDLKL